MELTDSENPRTIWGVIILQNGKECSVALLSGMEQLFNISLHENSPCLGL